MGKLKIQHLVLILSVVAAATAQADHNSVWGEGWADMPNDIHNTRVDTMDEDTDTFIDFVRMGAGADSVNRFSTDSVESGGTGGSGVSSGSGRQGGSRGGRS